MGTACAFVKVVKPVHDDRKAPLRSSCQHSRYITPVYVHHMGCGNNNYLCACE